MKRSNVSFEATFTDLDFLQNEDLKRARLRFNIPQPKHCSLPELNITVTDGKSGQVFGNYAKLPQNSGVNTVILTKSLQKLATSFNPSNELKIRITVRSQDNDQSLCSNVVSRIGSEAYLVTNTDEVKTRKRRSTDFMSRMLRRDVEDTPTLFRRNADDTPRMFRKDTEDSKRLFRRDAEDTPRMFRSDANGRSKRSIPKCTMKTVYVNLTSSNNSIFILPTEFKTGVCGLQQPVPLSSDPMIQQLASAIARAIKGVAPASNRQCCKPAKFKKLTVLYFDPSNVYAQHTVLRHVDNVVVTKCACSNKT